MMINSSRLILLSGIVLALVLSSSVSVRAQGGGSIIPVPDGEGGFIQVQINDYGLSPMANIRAIVAQESMRKELEIVDEQLDSITTIQNEYLQKLRVLLSDNATADELKSLNVQAEEALEGVLLPHQMHRIRQISAQASMERIGIVDFLISDEIGGQIGLSDRQIERIKDEYPEIAEKLAEEIREARQRARDELLSILTREQREELNEILGEEFDIPEARPFASKRPSDR